ncbi:hypothetical protein BXT86_00030 [candidate division WOR-3 bacterium 4484_100]|uniref:Fis family transcriptional regulator n=1 Tax=candidate division WOR-3 bacterium 4484_100 TaxID=1936077 RepID=A0A1V4QIU9_UNCW3|nr:MAG: hypothetical protein BXT86_00030 [candidate division WOR-3 bacterium 4484_100]
MVLNNLENILDSFADAIVALDRDFKIISFSRGAERITGYSAYTVLGKNFQKLFKTDILSPNAPMMNVLKDGASVSNQRGYIIDSAGKRINIAVNGSPLKNIAGEIVGLVLNFRDVDEVYRLYAALYKENARILAILNSITDGVMTVDNEWRITSFNPAAEKITGYRAEEVIGKICAEVMRSKSCEGDCPLRRTMQTQAPIYDFEMDFIKKDGEVVPISVNTALLIDEEGEIIGGVETFRDLSIYKRLTEELHLKYSFANLIGKDEKMQRIFALIKEISPTSTTVLVTGETGTGKELVARAIHYNSPRRNRPFVKIDCAALPETLLESELFGYKKGAFTDAKTSKPGKFELANGGTIFLDEIGELPMSIQAKLLRVLEQQEFEPLGGTRTVKVDVRIIAATNQDLNKAMREKRFREDLYYRLNVVVITLPPLRERVEDIPLLIEHFINIFREKFKKPINRVSSRAMDLLLDYPWPGNVRQLEHAIEHSFIHCQGRTIETHHLPDEIRKKSPISLGKGIVQSESPLEQAEKAVILEVLKDTNWNQKKAARRLNISRITLWRKLKKYGITPRIGSY